MSPSFIDKRRGAAVVLRVLLKSVGLVGIRVVVAQVKNMLSEGLRRCFFDFQIFEGSGTLRADCKTLVSRSDEDHWWRPL